MNERFQYSIVNRGIAENDYLKIRPQIIDLMLFAIFKTACKLGVFADTTKAAAAIVNHRVQRSFLICDSYPLYKYKALFDRGAFLIPHGGGR